MRYWDDLSLTQLLVGRIGHPKKDRSVLAFIPSLKTVPNVSVHRPDSLFLEQLSVWRSYPVSHISLKTVLTDSESGVGKRSHAGLTLLNLIDSFTKGFLESFSSPSCTRERNLPIFNVWKARRVM